MSAIWLTSAKLFGLAGAALALRTILVVRRYTPQIRRIFEERPLFQPTRGEPLPGAKELAVRTCEGLMLRGSYLATPLRPARGLVLFCHEFMGDRWSGQSYWPMLLEAGFDIVAFDFRNHGASDSLAGYSPMHWLTQYEVSDMLEVLQALGRHPAWAALPWVLYGISRGGSAAICAAATDPRVRAVVTDGAFPTHTTALIYMRKWLNLYAEHARIVAHMPDWYLAFIRDRALRRIERDRNCRFPRVEWAIAKLAPRPILMVHGQRDSYIRPEIARRLFASAGEPKQYWEVPRARHNRCIEVAADEYRRRLLKFLDQHLGWGTRRAVAA